MFEVNLVPDIKAELLKAQKMRRFVIFISILGALICVGIIIILGIIVGGQGIALASQDSEMQKKSDEILGYDNLYFNLTVQDQLSKLAQIGDNRRVLSRIFGILDAILPTGEDRVKISELSVNLPNSTLSFDGQADSASNIDYRALEVFKKTVELSHYDYGRYIDADGAEIPAVCIQEILEDDFIWGVYYKTEDGGCGPAPTAAEDELDTTTPLSDSESEPKPESETKPKPESESESESESETEPTPTATFVKIKRDMTPSELAKAIAAGKPYFRSACIEDEVNNCLLVEDPVAIRDSSNGRNSSGDLVLRFSATITISPEVFSFNNKHMLIISPYKQNVTDSYLQVRNMFTEEAEDCAIDDPACLNAPTGDL